MKCLEKTTVEKQETDRKRSKTVYIEAVSTSSVNPSDLVIQSCDTSNTFTYLTYQNTIPIFAISSFEPTDEQNTISTFINAMNAIAGSETLIVDVSGNGGGIICLSYLFLSLLVEDWKPELWLPQNAATLAAQPTNIFELYDVKESPLTTAAQGTFFSCGDYIDPTTLQQRTNNKYYTTTTSYTRGGATSQYSQKSYFPSECVSCFQKYANQVTSRPSKIILVSDGTCGSACNLFASKLGSYGKAVVVDHGGLPNVVMDYAQFAGGNVIEYDDAYTCANKTTNIHKFADTGAGRFNFNEMYMHGSSTPREFVQYCPDYQINTWDALLFSGYSTSQDMAAQTRLYQTIVDNIINAGYPTGTGKTSTETTTTIKGTQKTNVKDVNGSSKLWSVVQTVSLVIFAIFILI